MTVLRPLFAFALCALLALTTQAMAQARAGMGAGGVMAICTGHVVTYLPVDADGTPRVASHICPDCALTLADTAVNDRIGAPRPTEWMLYWERSSTRPARQSRWAARARGPPGNV